MRLHKKRTANLYRKLRQTGGLISPFKGNVHSTRHMRGGSMGSFFKTLVKYGKKAAPYIGRALKSSAAKRIGKAAMEKVPEIMAKRQTISGAAKDLGGKVFSEVKKQAGGTRAKNKKQKGGNRKGKINKINKNKNPYPFAF